MLLCRARRCPLVGGSSVTTHGHTHVRNGVGDADEDGMGKSAKNKAAKRNARVRAQAQSPKARKPRSGTKSGNPAKRTVNETRTSRSGLDASTSLHPDAGLPPMPGYTVATSASPKHSTTLHKATAVAMAALLTFALVISVMGAISAPDEVEPVVPVEQTQVPAPPAPEVPNRNGKKKSGVLTPEPTGKPTGKPGGKSGTGKR